MQRFRVSMLVVVVAGLTLAAVAHANVVGTGSDPAGDSSDRSPGRDIIGASLSYDRRSGELIGVVQMRDFPGEARALMTLFAGTRTATGCDGIPAAGFHSLTDEFDATWKRIDDPTGAGPSGDARKITYGGAVSKFEATADELVGQPYDCVIAIASDPGNPGNVYDVTDPIELVGQPALSVRVRGVGRPFKPNRARKLKITLANAGDAATRAVRLRLGRARGLRAKPATKSLGPIAPGAKRTVAIKVKLSGRARDATDVKLTASAGALIAREELTLRLRRPSKPGGGDGGRDRPTHTCTRWLPDPFGGTGGSLILVAC